MNILYLSNLSASNFTGPRYSVPRQVLAQSKYDHVFGYNISRIDKMKFQSVFPVVSGGSSVFYPGFGFNSFFLSWHTREKCHFPYLGSRWRNGSYSIYFFKRTALY